MKGKLIVIEGTDCSGKETQTKLLVEKLENDGIKCERFSFPNYDSPTGKIIGGPYLGKEHICNCWFKEGAVNVDPKVATLYYAADRKYNIYKIQKLIDSGVNVILDRYIYSNLAHQGGKIINKSKRYEMYEWINKLEFELLELPKADVRVFLHMNFNIAQDLRKNRKEALDQHESNKQHLLASENSYKEIASLYDFKTIECGFNNKPREIEDINQELYAYILKNI